MSAWFAHQLFLSLGSNLGDRRRHLEDGLAQMQPAVQVTAVSSLYETEPWGLEEQPAFYNICVAGRTELSVQPLLSFLKGIERQLGRQQTVRWGPRLIDIDILLYDELVTEEDNLSIPHPHMHERSFVMIPLREIAAGVRHPLTGRTVGDMATELDETAVTNLGTWAATAKG